MALVFGFVLYQLYQSTQIDYEPIDPEQMAEDLAITSFQECLEVFYRIGNILASGRLPADSLRCDESGSANIVVREGSEVKVSHPHPDFYGYSEIFVTSKNPQPQLVE